MTTDGLPNLGEKSGPLERLQDIVQETLYFSIYYPP
jgi:hypothetical protein